MKILHTVESYTPSINGMQQVVKQLSERLVLLGHDVTVATSANLDRTDYCINGVKIVEFKIAGNMVNGYQGTEQEIQRYRDFLINSSFDVITNFAAQQWATDIALPILEEIKAVKVFVPTGFSCLFRAEYNRYYESMKLWMKQYDVSSFLSHDYRDTNFAKEAGVTNSVVIPNGAAADEFLPDSPIDIRKKLGITTDSFFILHVGSHTGMKGHSEAIKIFKRAKIKNSTFAIIGNCSSNDSGVFRTKQILKQFLAQIPIIGSSIFPQCGSSCRIKGMLFNNSIFRRIDKKKIIIADLTRQETVSAYKAADLFLFPSNLECSPVVLFECMASRTPFLTSDVGNTKEIIDWCDSGMLLPTKKLPNNFSRVVLDKSAALVEMIHNNKSLRKKMSENGFTAWKNNFNWEKITADYEVIYKRLYNKSCCDDL